MLKTIKLDSDASKICTINLSMDTSDFPNREQLELMATFELFRTYSDDLIGNHKGKTKDNNLDYGQELTESRLRDSSCIQTDKKYCAIVKTKHNS